MRERFFTPRLRVAAYHNRSPRNLIGCSTSYESAPTWKMATALVSFVLLIRVSARENLQQRVANLRGAIVVRTESARATLLTQRAARTPCFDRVGAILANGPLVGVAEQRKLAVQLTPSPESAVRAAWRPLSDYGSCSPSAAVSQFGWPCPRLKSRPSMRRAAISGLGCERWFRAWRRGQ